MKSQKQEAIDSIQALPDDVSIDDILDELAYLELVKARIATADEDEVVSHEEAMKLLSRWPTSSGR